MFSNNEGYTAELVGDVTDDNCKYAGNQIFIPNWPANTQFENLASLCKVFGSDNIVAIALEKSTPHAMQACMNATDEEQASKLLLYVVQQARIEDDKGNAKKLTSGSVQDMPITVLLELFIHVVHSQYEAFFALGLAKAPSQDL